MRLTTQQQQLEGIKTMSFIDSYRTAKANRKPRTRGSYIRQTLYCTLVFTLFTTFGPTSLFPIPGYNS